MSVKGIDISSYQAGDFSTSGLSFVFVKVTEGLTYVNPKWPTQRATARKAGLATGFYHYPHIANSPTAEADHFLAQIALAAGDMIALDWEWYGQSVSDATARAYKRSWISHVKAKAPGHRVGLYVDRSNWTTVDTDSYCGDFLWIADVTTAGHPRIQHAWTFHQYSSSGGVDHDVANFGSAAALRAWAADSKATTPPEEDDMPQWHEGRVPAGPEAITVPVPHGDAWKAYPHRRLHLTYDQIGTKDATADVRVAVHGATSWNEPSVVKVPASGASVSVPLADTDVKVSLQTTSSGVSYALETW